MLGRMATPPPPPTASSPLLLLGTGGNEAGQLLLCALSSAKAVGWPRVVDLGWILGWNKLLMLTRRCALCWCCEAAALSCLVRTCGA